MEDITGLGKLAESKLANSIYDDAASPAAREIGSAAADLLKTMRLFTAPFQLAAVAQDRFRRWLDEVRDRVPPERQVEAPPTIAGPALRAMQFMEEDNPLARMFVSLLSQAIDRDHQSGVHPAFVKVLEQISPDEALLLSKLRVTAILGANTVHHVEDGEAVRVSSVTSFPQDDFSDPDSISMYFDHLESLSLVRHAKDIEVVPPPDHPEFKNYRWYELTSFGYRFLSVCGQE